MTPSECKTKARAIAAAGAVFEARVVVARIAGDPENLFDRALYELEHAYWNRADALATSKRKGRKR